MADSARVGLVLATFFAAAAVLGAYLPLWMADRGLAPAEIGLILGAGSLFRILGVPGAGWLADRLGRRRTVLLGAAAIAAGTAALLPSTHGVAATLAVVAMLGTAASMLAPLTDAVTVGLANARRLDYGRTRAWGSVSYMVATAGAGSLLAGWGSGVVPPLLALGYGAAALCALGLPEVSVRIATPTLAPWRSPLFRLALLGTALIQGSHAAYYSFAPLLWRGAGIGDGTIGLLIAEGILAEIALFVWGGRLAERLGPAGLTAVAASACLVRWTATALTTDVAWLAAIQLLHGVTFAFQHLSSMAVLGRLPGARAGMAQAVLSAVGFSLATGVLVWVTGRLYAPLGALVFLPMAAVGGAALFTVPLLARALRRPPV